MRSGRSKYVAPVKSVAGSAGTIRVNAIELHELAWFLVTQKQGEETVVGADERLVVVTESDCSTTRANARIYYHEMDSIRRKISDCLPEHKRCIHDVERSHLVRNVDDAHRRVDR